MLSYDPPMPANQGHKDTPNVLTGTNGAVNTYIPSSKPNGLSNGVSTVNKAPASSQKHHHIWLVTGPAGCGKTTIAQYLASQLNLPYIEGDSYHTPANVEKMRTGTPLTDADRWDWLTALRDESVHRISAGSDGVILTCSALKRKYRDVIRVAAYFDRSVLVHFIFLDAPEEVLLDRLSRRKDHYFGADMLHSQFDILERPLKDEKDVITIDVSREVDEVKDVTLHRVATAMASDNE